MEAYMQKQFTEEQIIGVFQEAEVDGAVIREVSRKHNITEQTFLRWRDKYGDMTVGSKTPTKRTPAGQLLIKIWGGEQELNSY
jgi:putative transposase